MKTKIKMAIWGLLLVFSFSYANEKSNETVLETEPLRAAKTLKNWAARHGMSSKVYQDNFTKFSKKGFRLTAVDGYLVNGKIYYAALWEKGNTSGLVARHGLTGKQYQAEFSKWSKKGYRLIHVDGYSDGKRARYAAIWQKGSQAGLKARHGLTGKQYQSEFTKNHKAGYRLIHVSGYGVKGKLYYAAIWKKGKNNDYVARHGLSSKQYQAVFTKYAKKGYKLTHIDSYDAKNKVYYACIMEKVKGRYSARHGMNGTNYQLQYDNHYYQGFIPVSVSGHDGGKRAGYAASFKAVGGWKYADVKQLDAKIRAVQKQFKIPGVSIAIVKDGKLVYAKGYGYGEKDKKEIASASSLFRQASISKSFTSVAIMKLVEQGKLKLTDKVFGPGKILGTTYGTKAYSSREKAITVQHLLEHTAGGHAWDHNSKPDNVDTWAAAMKLGTKESFSALFKRILDGRNPTHTPGTFYEYSNFGYCVLGRIITKKSGMSYEKYVKKYVLKPSGISRMRIGPSDKKYRAYKEVAYYNSDWSPYNLKMQKMDAHGGWIASSVDLMRFMVRVDGQASKKDIIKASTFSVMTTSSLNNGYAKGWSVNGSASRMSHGGGMSGTSTTLKKMNNSISYAILSNSTGNGSGQGGALATAIEQGINAIGTWPNLDLF
jgi:CubicO group peptidase (beta-lactamase class C family)